MLCQPVGRCVLIKLQMARSVPQWAGAALLGLLLPLFALQLMAAPVTTTDDADSQGDARDPLLTSGRPSAAPIAGARGLDKSLGQEASTGNKNLDLLLELQGKPGDDLRQAAPRSAAAASSASSAAASAAATELAALRAKAADRSAQNLTKQGDLKPKAAPQPFEGMGTLEGEARAAQPTERRQWSGQLAGGSGGGTGYSSDGSGEPGSSRGGYDDDDNVLRRLPRELIAFLRDNRYWLMGALGGLVVVGAAIKAYSRRI